MSGRRIDDHSAWMGKGKNYPLPDGPHKLKAERGCEGAGHIADYPDTTEDIHRDQEASVRHLESKRMKPGYRY